MKPEEKMTAKEIARANEWLLSHGHTYEELADFANYIARKKVLKKNAKSRVLPPLTTNGEPD